MFLVWPKVTREDDLTLTIKKEVSGKVFSLVLRENTSPALWGENVLYILSCSLPR